MDKSVLNFIDNFGITDRAREFLGSEKGHFINGQFVAGGDLMAVLEPCTGGLLTSVLAGTDHEVDAAVAAARAAFDGGEWSRWTPIRRERVLMRLADLVELNLQTLAEIEAIDAGKAISGCKVVDIQGSVDVLRYMAGWATKIDGATRSVSTPGQHFSYTLKEPVGVVAAIVPWNWPFNMGIWKLAAPLAAGCTVVLKPAQLTPLSMIFFAELCIEAGLPPGVLNIVTGRGSTIGDRLTHHPLVDKVSFTGSTDVGIDVGKAAMSRVNHVTLELGGKSPMIVFEDAEIERVVEATQQSIFFNTGQVCSAGSRLYVHRSIYQETVKAVADRAKSMLVGMTLDEQTEMGPAISSAHKASVLEYVKIGIEEGAHLVCGGQDPGGEGFFLQPTVFSECTNGMRIVQEEIFGPVLVIIPFDTEEEVIGMANDNIYGLAASIFTSSISRAHKLIPHIKAGTVWVNTHDVIDANTPFGGVKQSGIGKDLGPEQLQHYLETKMVWITI